MKVGLEVREPLLLTQAAPPDMPIDERTSGWRVLSNSMLPPLLNVAGRIKGFAAGIGLPGHAVAQTKR